jgi:hypothetical protein
MGDGDDEFEVGQGTINIRARKGQVAYWKEAAAEQGMTLSAWLKGLATREANATFEGLDKKHGARNKKEP